MSLTAPIKLFSGTESKYLAEKIAEGYGADLGKSAKQVFSDGEFQPSYEETVRGNHVFVIQSTFDVFRASPRFISREQGKEGRRLAPSPIPFQNARLPCEQDNHLLLERIQQRHSQ